MQTSHHPKVEYFYTGGARDLTIVWVTQGARFIVNEYDGSESIDIDEDIDWFTA